MVASPDRWVYEAQVPPAGASAEWHARVAPLFSLGCARVRKGVRTCGETAPSSRLDGRLLAHLNDEEARTLPIPSSWPGTPRPRCDESGWSSQCDDTI